MTSNVFTIGLINQYHLQISNDIFEPFAKAKQSRVKVKAFYNDKTIEFYAAVKKDKKSDTYRMMFGKRLQKELGVFQNDYFEMQFFEDTSKYGVDVPEELEAVLLSDYEAYQIFEALTAGKQRSIIYTIVRIKSTQSRIDKALIMCDNLRRNESDAVVQTKLISNNFVLLSEVEILFGSSRLRSNRQKIKFISHL